MRLANPFAGGGGTLKAWAAPESAVIARDTPPEADNDVFSAASHLVRLDAAVNESAAFQLVLTAEGGRPATVREVKFDDFRQGDRVIPAARARLYRAAWVSVTDYPSWYLRLTPHLRQPRQIADALIPLTAPKGGLPIAVEPNVDELLWAEIRVPPGAEAGLYRSVLRITPTQGAPTQLDVALTVLPFALPQTQHLQVLTGIHAKGLVRQHIEVDGKPYAPDRLASDDPVYPRAAAVIDATVRILHEHRCSPILRDIYPVRRPTAAGRIELDWSDYDRLLSAILDGSAFEDRAAPPAWPMPIDEAEPAPEAYGGWGSAGYDRVLIDYLRQCVAHAIQRGWMDRHFVWFDLPGSRADRYRRFDHLGRVIKQADTRLNLVCDLTPQSMAPYGWQGDGFTDLSPYVGTWCPPASLMDPAALARERAGAAGKASTSAAGAKRTWFRPDLPPYAGSLSLIAPPTHVASLPVEAYRYGLGGILVPSVDEWTADGAPRAAGSEAALLWPGKPYGLETPIPSIRLKRLLRGLEDYEYLWLLERNRRPGIARVIAGDLVAYGGTDCYGDNFLDGRPGGWVTDPASWRLARRLMARELASVMQAAERGTPAGAESVTGFESEVDWARLASTVRQVRVDVEGARVHLDPRNASHPLEVEANLWAFNASHQPYSGQAKLADLATGWIAGTPAEPVKALQPLRATRRTVRARTASIQPNADGVAEIKVALQGSGQPIEVSGRLCVVTAQRLTKPVTLDGKLDDWPLGAGNVAGDFVLVGALDVPKEGRATTDRPTLPTSVFVANDSEYLYIAFNCEDDRLAERRITRSNSIGYDGLWPTGEDLVEVVLDPTGAGLDPGDVLHILVKANGAVITERGVTCMDRVYPSGPWPAGVTAVVDDTAQPNRWTVEIQVPLLSLGKHADVWGINFARYNPRLGEYSTWSAARQYLYNPATLGSIRLAR
jgi:hypothetical protein